MRNRILFTAFALFCGASVAVAADASTPKGDWIIGQINAASTSGVGYCSMKNEYTNGDTLVFARDAEGSNSLAIDFHNKILETGGQYNVKLKVGGLQREMMAIAATPSVFIIQMGLDRDFYQTLQHRASLQVDFQTSQMSFGLEGTRDGLTALTSCAMAVGSRKHFAEMRVPLSKVPDEAALAATEPAAGEAPVLPPAAFPAQVPGDAGTASAAAATTTIPASEAAAGQFSGSLGAEAVQATLADQIAALKSENRKLLLENQRVAENMQTGMNPPAVPVEAVSSLPLPMAAPVYESPRNQAPLSRKQQALASENARLKAQLRAAQAQAEQARREAAMIAENAMLKEQLAALQNAKTGTPAAAANAEDVTSKVNDEADAAKQKADALAKAEAEAVQAKADAEAARVKAAVAAAQAKIEADAAQAKVAAEAEKQKAAALAKAEADAARQKAEQLAKADAEAAKQKAEQQAKADAEAAKQKAEQQAKADAVAAKQKAEAQAKADAEAAQAKAVADAEKKKSEQQAKAAADAAQLQAAAEKAQKKAAEKIQQAADAAKKKAAEKAERKAAEAEKKRLAAEEKKAAAEQKKIAAQKAVIAPAAPAVPKVAMMGPPMPAVVAPKVEAPKPVVAAVTAPVVEQPKPQAAKVEPAKAVPATAEPAKVEQVSAAPVHKSLEIVSQPEGFLYTLLARSHVPGRQDPRNPGTYTWSAAGVQASAQEQDLKGANLADAAGSYVQKQSKSCHGDFAHKTGAVKVVGGTQIMEGELACVNGKNDAAAAVLFIAHDGKLAIITHGGPATSMEKALVERDAMISTISR